MAKGKNKKDLLSISDFDKEEIYSVLKEALKLKKSIAASSKVLLGKTLGLIFQKPSTRTSVSFMAGMYQLGGASFMLNASDLQIKRGESLGDTGKTLSRYLNAIVVRANKHNDVAELARCASIPIINGLTDKEHPCQVLGDLLTIIESKKLSKPQDLAKITVAYIGDGNNVAHSWMLAAGILGINFVVSSPEGYWPEEEFLKKANSLAGESKGKIVYEKDPFAAVESTDVVYADVWASMGKDEERGHRKNIFMPFQVNSKLLSSCKKDYIVMHCLPAHSGEEITDDVIDGKHSVVFDQAENRMKKKKAILIKLIGGK